MSRICKIYIFIIIIFTNSYSQQYGKFEKLPEFRNFIWGESIENVRSIELLKYMQESMGFGEEVLSYYGKITGIDARVDYVFKSGKLVEGIYEITVENFDDEFEKVKTHFINKYDYPIYWANAHPNTNINWTDSDKNGFCRGPEIYWDYVDGFLAIITEKYNEEITITILFAHEKTIKDYGKYVKYPYQPK